MGCVPNLPLILCDDTGVGLVENPEQIMKGFEAFLLEKVRGPKVWSTFIK